MISRFTALLGATPKATDAPQQNVQLPLPFKLKSAPDTRTTWQRTKAYASAAPGCALFPIALPIRATQFATKPLTHFFRETRIGKFTAYAMPVVLIGTSMARSRNDYHHIEQLRQDYTEQHDFSDDYIETILDLPHIDRDNSIDRTHLVAIAENISTTTVVEDRITILFDELHTVASRKLALDELIRVIDGSDASAELKDQYIAFAVSTSQTSDELPALTWAASIRLIHEYGHETKLVEQLIPHMFDNVRTPQGSLVMTHVLLEAFQLNNNLTPDQRTRYQFIVDLKFMAFQKKFSDNIAQTLSDNGLLDIETNAFIPVKITDSNTKAFAPYTIDADKLALVLEVEEQMDLERTAIVDLMRAHQEWVLTKLPENSSDDIKATIANRDEAFVRAYPENFQVFAKQLEQKEYFGARVVQSYSVMTNDFERLNTGYVSAYVNDMSAGSLGLSGFVGMVAGGWIFPEGGLVYSFYAGAGSAALFTPSNVSDTYYHHRKPLVFALPGEGIMYDSPKDESIF